MNETQIQAAILKLNDQHKSVKNGYILNNANSVKLLWEKKDLLSLNSVVHATDYNIYDKKALHAHPNRFHGKNVSVSPSGKYVAVLQPVSESNTRKDQVDKVAAVIEVWNDCELKHVFRPLKCLHGNVYAAPGTAALSWSFDESKLAYIAEKKQLDGQMHWNNPHEKDSDKEYKGKFDYQEDWGEQNVGHVCGQVFVANFEIEKCVAVPGLPENVSIEEVVWAPEGNGMVCTGYDTQNPSRLGLVYCINRKSSLYYVNEKDDNQVGVNITTGDATARCPRFSPDGKHLVYLATGEITTHFTSSALMMISWSNSARELKEAIKLVDVVDEPAQNKFSTNAFNGIYAHALPIRCWQRNVVYFNTFVGSRLVWKFVDIQNGKVGSPAKYIQQDVGMERILDIAHGCILVEVGSPICASSVYLYNTEKEYILIQEQQTSQYIKSWKLDTISPSVPVATEMINGLNHPNVDELNLCLTKTPESDHHYEYIVLLPKGDMPNDGWPLVVDIHGGPHGVTPAMFKLSNEIYCSLGIAVVIVNYRGSVGFGTRALESIIGRAGTQDVADVQRVVEHCVYHMSNTSFDSSKIVCTGGSHGGFISCHLIGKYPSFYRTCVVRNPVTNLVSLFLTSDIPDWTCAVSGLNSLLYATFPSYFPNAMTPVPVQNNANLSGCLQYLLSLSPMGNNLSTIKTSILFGLGEKDRRVPPTEGLQFHKALSALGVESKVLWYPEDCHPLASIDAYGDFAVWSIHWILQHIA